NTRQIRDALRSPPRSGRMRSPVCETAALPTELHRRKTRCMVAHPGVDVRTGPVTWGSVNGTVIRRRLRDPSRHVRSATARGGPAAALCAEYVLKFSWRCAAPTDWI